MRAMAVCFNFPHGHELLRIGVGKRAQEHRIHNREDCSGCANAERQRQNSDDGESRILQECANSEAEVLPEVIHWSRLRIVRAHPGLLESNRGIRIS